MALAAGATLYSTRSRSHRAMEGCRGRPPWFPAMTHGEYAAHAKPAVNPEWRQRTRDSIAGSGSSKL